MEASVDAALKAAREIVHAASHLAHESARLGTVADTPEGARLVAQARSASMRAATAAFALDDALRGTKDSAIVTATADALDATEAALAASRAILGPSVPAAVEALRARRATPARDATAPEPRRP